MMPYVWTYRGRVLLALGCLVISKLAMVGVPVVLKYIVDGLDGDSGQAVVLPISLLLAYGLLRFTRRYFCARSLPRDESAFGIGSESFA